MAFIKPFRALRPVPEKAKQVSCVPYDVVRETEVRAFIEDNPLSFLRVTRPEVEPLADDHPTASQVNAAARRELERLITDGVFVREREPAVYIYRLESDTIRQTGVVACCSLDEYENGLIKRHEKTRPDKVEDRTNHMLELRAQTGLILLAHRRDPDLASLVAAETAAAPIYDFYCTTGVRQTIWRAAATVEIVAAFSSVSPLYIADGHHRIESARRAREILRQSDAAPAGDEDYNFVIAGLFPADELRILPYNRVVTDLNGLSDDEFLVRVQESFVITGEACERPQNHGEICIYLNGVWRTLKFAVEFIRAPDPIERLDVSILQNYILGPILGIDDPRTDERIGFVGGDRGSQALRLAVDSGEAKIAFSLFPTTMDDLLAVSDMDAIMPPKSTWFEPKLKDGLLVHEI